MRWGCRPARPRAKNDARRRGRARSDNQLGPEGGKALGDALARGAFPALQTLDLRWVHHTARTREGVHAAGAWGRGHTPRGRRPTNSRPHHERWGREAAAVGAIRLGCGPVRPSAAIETRRRCRARSGNLSGGRGCGALRRAPSAGVWARAPAHRNCSAPPQPRPQ